MPFSSFFLCSLNIRESICLCRAYTKKNHSLVIFVRIKVRERREREKRTGEREKVNVLQPLKEKISTKKKNVNLICGMMMCQNLKRWYIAVVSRVTAGVVIIFMYAIVIVSLSLILSFFLFSSSFLSSFLNT